MQSTIVLSTFIVATAILAFRQASAVPQNATAEASLRFLVGNELSSVLGVYTSDLGLIPAYDYSKISLFGFKTSEIAALETNTAVAASVVGGIISDPHVLGEITASFSHDISVYQSLYSAYTASFGTAAGEMPAATTATGISASLGSLSSSSPPSTSSFEGGAAVPTAVKAGGVIAAAGLAAIAIL